MSRLADAHFLELGCLANDGFLHYVKALRIYRCGISYVN
jgi:hypothetical protein